MHDKIDTSHKSIILTFEYLQMFNNTFAKIYVNFFYSSVIYARMCIRYLL